MKTTKIKTSLGLLEVIFHDTKSCVVSLPKEKFATVNRVNLYFTSNDYKFEGDTWKSSSYSSFYIPERWGKEVSRPTKDKVHGIIINALNEFVQCQTLFMLAVKLSALEAQIETAHYKQSSNNDEVARLQKENLDLQSQIAGWMVEISMSKQRAKTKQQSA